MIVNLDSNPILGQACFYKSCVYLRNYRVASTYYYNGLVKGLKWTPKEFREIDWESEIVFSHITDPIKRRHKGIAKWLIENSLVNEYYNNVDMQYELSHKAYIDNHSASVYHMVGDRTDHIHWILADYNNFSLAYESTTNFLKQYNVMLPKEFPRNSIAINKAFYSTKKLYDHIEETFLKNNPIKVYEYFEKDLLLVNNLKKEII